MIIYKIENKIDGKIYIGKTTRNLDIRIEEHFNCRKDDSYLHKAIRKYGKDNFIISTIEEVNDIKTLNDREKFWINYFNCKSPKGYNLTDGGDGVIGYLHTNETKKKISDCSKGRTFITDGKTTLFIKKEDANNFIDNNKNWYFGNSSFDKSFYNTELFKDKMSKANKGRIAYNNGEKCVKIFEHEIEKYENMGYKKGGLQSKIKYNWYTNGIDSVRVNVGDELNLEKGWHRGRSWKSMNISDEKHKAAALIAAEKLKKRGRPIRCIELDRVFENISAVEEWLGKSARHIYECCRGVRSKSNGYSWEWADKNNGV